MILFRISIVHCRVRETEGAVVEIDRTLLRWVRSNFSARLCSSRTECVHLFQNESYGVLSDDCNVRLKLMNFGICFCKFC